MSKKRCIILIDGSNFYFKLKDLNLQNLLEFNFSEFAKFISSKNEIASLAMVANCSESRLLKKEDLEPFIKEK